MSRRGCVLSTGSVYVPVDNTHPLLDIEVIHAQETRWQSGVRSCIMTGLPRHLLQEWNVGIVAAPLLAVKLTNLKLELKSMLTPKALVFLPVQSIWKECFPEQKIQIDQHLHFHLHLVLTQDLRQLWVKHLARISSTVLMPVNIDGASRRRYILC